jgi:hypothetical protein
MPDQYVPQGRRKQRVVRRQDGPAREPEDYFDTLLLEAANECLGPGELLHD